MPWASLPITKVAHIKVTKDLHVLFRYNVNVKSLVHIHNEKKEKDEKEELYNVRVIGFIADALFMQTNNNKIFISKISAITRIDSLFKIRIKYSLYWKNTIQMPTLSFSVIYFSILNRIYRLDLGDFFVFIILFLSVFFPFLFFLSRSSQQQHQMR